MYTIIPRRKKQMCLRVKHITYLLERKVKERGKVTFTIKNKIEK